MNPRSTEQIWKPLDYEKMLDEERRKFSCTSSSPKYQIERIISSIKLYNWLQNYLDQGPNPSIILIDIRPTSLFHNSHIRGSTSTPNIDEAIRLIFPILTIGNKTDLIIIHEGLKTSAKTSVRSDDNISSLPYEFAQVFGSWKSRGLINLVWLLQGGISSFELNYSFLCTSTAFESIHLFQSYPLELIPQTLYIGGMVHATSVSILRTLKINTIIDLTSCSLANSPPACIPQSHVFSFSKLNKQSDDFSNFLIEICKILKDLTPLDCNCRSNKEKRPNNRILIACNDGNTFSPTIAVAYLMYSQSISLNTALGEIIKLKKSFRLSSLHHRILLNLESSLPHTIYKVHYNYTKPTATSGVRNKKSYSDLSLIHYHKDEVIASEGFIHGNDSVILSQKSKPLNSKTNSNKSSIIQGYSDYIFDPDESTISNSTLNLYDLPQNLPPLLTYRPSTLVQLITNLFNPQEKCISLYSHYHTPSMLTLPIIDNSLFLHNYRLVAEHFFRNPQQSDTDPKDSQDEPSTSLLQFLSALDFFISEIFHPTIFQFSSEIIVDSSPSNLIGVSGHFRDKICLTFFIIFRISSFLKIVVQQINELSNLNFSDNYKTSIDKIFTVISHIYLQVTITITLFKNTQFTFSYELPATPAQQRSVALINIFDLLIEYLYSLLQEYISPILKTEKQPENLPNQAIKSLQFCLVAIYGGFLKPNSPIDEISTLPISNTLDSDFENSTLDVAFSLNPSSYPSFFFNRLKSNFEALHLIDQLSDIWSALHPPNIQGMFSGRPIETDSCGIPQDLGDILRPFVFLFSK